MKHSNAIKNVILSLILAAAAPAAVTAQEQGFVTGSKIGDIILADVGGFGCGFAAVGLNFLALGILGADGELGVGDQMLGSAMTELADIPLFLSGSPDAVGLAVGGAALWGLEALADAGYGNFSTPANLLYWGKNDLTMYKAYDSYASYRLRSPAWDNSSFRRHGFLDLMAAPLDYRVYGKAQTWIAMGGGIAANILMMLAMSPDPWENAVWNTGRWYIGDEEANPAAFILTNLAYNAVSSAYTGVGEEAVFRGVLHEELSLYAGSAWATVLDTVAFCAMHLFTDLARGMDWGYIGAHMLVVCAGNLLNDWAYEDGGLALAVSCHALFDFTAFCFAALASEGVPRSARGH